jgi:hypothetical protein
MPGALQEYLHCQAFFSFLASTAQRRALPQPLTAELAAATAYYMLLLLLLLLCLHRLQLCKWMCMTPKRTSTSSNGIFTSTHEKYLYTLQEQTCK